VTTLHNVFADVSETLLSEEIVELLSRPGLTIERIVSTGHASPPGFWYDAPAAEWVLVLSGKAALRFEDEAAPRLLEPGDFVDIAPHRRHRVESTDAQVPTIWLAVHYACDPDPLTSSVQAE
jgi:cupin 2 domain-containing protein